MQNLFTNYIQSISASKSKELQISAKPSQKLSPQKRIESKPDKGVLPPSKKTISLSKDTISKDISQAKEAQEDIVTVWQAHYIGCMKEKHWMSAGKELKTKNK